MSDPVRWTGQMPATRGQQQAPAAGGGANLADILERVLDKGIVIAGDVQINLLDIELLTIKLRLVVASVDRAKEMGIDWWERDPTLSSGHQELVDENRRLRERLESLERGAETPTALTNGAEPDEPDEVVEVEDASEADDGDLDDGDLDDDPEEPEEADEVDEGADEVEEIEEEPEPEPAEARPRRKRAARSGGSGGSGGSGQRARRSSR